MSDLSRWQADIAFHYSRTLDEFPLYELTDDPKMVSLRHLYTRTEMTDTKGWPPTATERKYDDYSSLFVTVCNFTASFKHLLQFQIYY